MQRRSLVLIGLPGACKSTTGVLIVRERGETFIDVDLLIQEKESALLQEIIDRVGFADLIIDCGPVDRRGNAGYYQGI